LMQLFRIAGTQFAAEIGGEGARLYGGRWNQIGDPVLYMTEDLSLAILETVGHANPRRKMKRALLVLNVPDDASVETVTNLPESWNTYPYLSATACLGSQWIQERRSLLLRVPSAVTSGVAPDLWQYNVLANPLHPEFSKVLIDRITPWHPDARLL
ncbi:MAG: RES family NAD+ phosphorylase, partial [Candidatus Marinimicrobia bacterium]|nr:RES family NAD+ phosphorylase [Candidatus Neomarinimicrobiota bacterium]